MKQLENGKLEEVETAKTKITTVRVPIVVFDHFQKKGHGELTRFILSAIIEKWNKEVSK